jgi:alkylated DNA repair protein alkB family protein 1
LCICFFVLKFISDKCAGLLFLPDLLPPVVQQCLLDVLLHREFSKPENQTNFHLNYHVSYPEKQASFFSTHAESSSFIPKDPLQNKPLSNSTALDKGLHWITLGGQYDWTNKVYPPETPPKFADDIASLVGNIFTDMIPEAAIINVYSARDKLSMHRDVSEEADRGLVSISLGCSCIFIIGLQDTLTGELHCETLRLNSGDAVYMAGESRYAWHGVPRIIPDTCPEYLQYWPGNMYPEWSGWMSKKRINLNIRQMFESCVVGPDG